MTTKLALLGLLTVALFSGCYEFRDGIDDTAISMKTRFRAAEAWAGSQDLYEGVDYQAHFGAGFRDGYFDVALGGNGCLPTLPPRKYWGAWYQTERGKDQVKSYFDGYSHGVLAARDDDAARYNEISTSGSFKTPSGNKQGWLEPIPAPLSSAERRVISDAEGTTFVRELPWRPEAGSAESEVAASEKTVAESLEGTAQR